jgi:hypothetical protein
VPPSAARADASVRRWRVAAGAVKLDAVEKWYVALAGCRWSGQGKAVDLYPDPDAGPLQQALGQLGARSELVAWDDPGVDWGSYTHVLISSTWDSIERAEEYLGWARKVADVTVLLNPLPVIEWGFDKIHHQELAAAGVPVVPTTWVSPESRWTPPAQIDFVVKPSVSAGARQTACYRSGDHSATGHVLNLQSLGHTVMVQPYISRIEDEGEIDIVFFGGVFSHAVLKKMALVPGEGVVDRPWERMSWAGVMTPTPAQLEASMRALTFVADRLGGQLPYARIDLVPGPHGEPLVLEVELIDPYLSLDLEPGAAKGFAEALLRPTG